MGGGLYYCYRNEKPRNAGLLTILKERCPGKDSSIYNYFPNNHPFYLGNNLFFLSLIYQVLRPGNIVFEVKIIMLSARFYVLATHPRIPQFWYVIITKSICCILQQSTVPFTPGPIWVRTLTTCRPLDISRKESLPRRVGLRPNLSEFSPAIPGLKPPLLTPASDFGSEEIVAVFQK